MYFGCRRRILFPGWAGDCVILEKHLMGWAFKEAEMRCSVQSSQLQAES